MSVTSTRAATPRLHASACSPLAAEVRNAIPRELLRLRRNNGFWTDDKTSICTVSFTTKISRGGGCRRFLPGRCVRLVLNTRSLDAKLDRLAQARGNEVGFRVIP